MRFPFLGIASLRVMLSLVGLSVIASGYMCADCENDQKHDPLGHQTPVSDANPNPGLGNAPWKSESWRFVILPRENGYQRM